MLTLLTRLSNLSLMLCVSGHPVFLRASNGNEDLSKEKEWSKEAIIDLVAVLIALLALLLVSSRFRRWIAGAFGCMYIAGSKAHIV